MTRNDIMFSFFDCLYENLFANVHYMASLEGFGLQSVCFETIFGLRGAGFEISFGRLGTQRTALSCLKNNAPMILTVRIACLLRHLGCNWQVAA